MYKPATILMIEDDPGDQKLIKKSLSSQKLGNEIKVADNAENALEYLDQSKPIMKISRCPTLSCSI